MILPRFFFLLSRDQVKESNVCHSSFLANKRGERCPAALEQRPSAQVLISTLDGFGPIGTRPPHDRCQRFTSTPLMKFRGCAKQTLAHVRDTAHNSDTRAPHRPLSCSRKEKESSAAPDDARAVIGTPSSSSSDFFIFLILARQGTRLEVELDLKVDARHTLALPHKSFLARALLFSISRLYALSWTVPSVAGNGHQLFSSPC